MCSVTSTSWFAVGQDSGRAEHVASAQAGTRNKTLPQRNWDAPHMLTYVCWLDSVMRLCLGPAAVNLVQYTFFGLHVNVHLLTSAACPDPRSKSRLAEIRLRDRMQLVVRFSYLIQHHQLLLIR